jgi:hypothetical protein
MRTPESQYPLSQLTAYDRCWRKSGVHARRRHEEDDDDDDSSASGGDCRLRTNDCRRLLGRPQILCHHDAHGRPLPSPVACGRTWSKATCARCRRSRPPPRSAMVASLVAYPLAFPGLLRAVAVCALLRLAAATNRTVGSKDPRIVYTGPWFDQVSLSLGCGLASCSNFRQDNGGHQVCGQLGCSASFTFKGACYCIFPGFPSS